LASVIGIASADSALAPVLGILLSLVFVHVFSFQPFKENGDNTLSIVLTYSLTFIFLGALLVKVAAVPESGFEQVVFGYTLVFVLSLGPALILFESAYTIGKSFLRLRKKAILSETPVVSQQTITQLRRPKQSHILLRGGSLVRRKTKPRETAPKAALLLDSSSSSPAEPKTKEPEDSRFRVSIFLGSSEESEPKILPLGTRL